MAIPAGAAKHMTVAQLEEALNATDAKHRSDTQMIRQISGIVLSERLSEAPLARLEKELDATSQVALALHLLADESAFLNPPPNELPAVPAPDNAAQQAMLEAARRYVSQTLPRLPNFLATRTTNRYDDNPESVKKGTPRLEGGMHLVDTSSFEVSVRNEPHPQSTGEGAGDLQAKGGLTSSGEFGSTLGMILTDTAKGEISWGHWEQTPAGLTAVFNYSVPRSASHYAVVGVVPQISLGGGPPPSITSRTRSGGFPFSPNNNPSTFSPIRVNLGYRGSLWLDPATGTILRVTVKGELKLGDPFVRADMLVQYGEVEIGDGKFICPVRSLAFSVPAGGAQFNSGDRATRSINESLFTGYHRFAATARVLPDIAARSPEEPANEGAKPQ
jgi:hypothetical protein